jgi:hypothetical protein
MSQRRWLRMTETFNGMTRLEPMLGPVEAAIVRTAMNTGKLPETAGEPTVCAVITDLDDLTRQLQPGDTCASTLNGTPITPNTARMLACDAGISRYKRRVTTRVATLRRARTQHRIAPQRSAGARRRDVSAHSTRAPNSRRHTTVPRIAEPNVLGPKHAE